MTGQRAANVVTRRGFLGMGARAAGLLSLVGTGASLFVDDRAVAADAVLLMGNEGDVSTLDPHFATTTPSYPIVWMLFNSLVRFPVGVIDFNRIEPSLATKWTNSKELTEWTFVLRPGVKWHDGSGEVAADDVVFSFERILDPATGSPWRADYAEVAKVTAVDRSTVKFTLKSPNPFFLMKLVDYHGGFIIPRKAVEKLGKAFGLNPVGTGRFAFRRYDPRDKIVLERFDGYFLGPAKLGGVTSRIMPDINSRTLALRAGELHTAIGSRTRSWIEQAKSYGLTVEGVGEPGGVTLHFNMAHKPLDNELVRKALAYAISREQLIAFTSATIARPMHSPVPSDNFGWTTDGLPRYGYDPSKAKQLLAQAGYSKGLTLHAFMSESELYLPLMQVIQEQWRRVGVELELKVVDHPTYHKLIRQDLNDVVIYDASRVPLAEVYLSQFYSRDAIVGTPTAVTNFSHIGGVIPGIDAYLEQARQTLDLKRKRELYAAAQKRIVDVMAVMPLIERRGVGVRTRAVDLGYKDTMFLIDHYYYTESTRIV